MTHTYFSGWGSYAVTGGCVHAQATPSPKGVTAVPHPLQPSGLRTRGIPSRCSPPVCHLVARPHCRVCVRHSRAGRLTALNAVSPHSHAVTSGDTLVGVDQHPRRRLPGPRNGLVGHHRRSRPTSPTAIHKSAKRSSLVVRRPVLQTNCSLLGRARGLWVIAVGV